MSSSGASRMPLSERDQEFIQLFRWTIETLLARKRFATSASVREFLLDVDNYSLPDDLRPVLTKYRHLNSLARERKVDQLLSQARAHQK